MTTAIPRPVDVARGWDAIAKALRVSRDAVRSMCLHSPGILHDGCPIVLDHTGTPRADKAELWAWYKSVQQRQ